MTDWDKHKYSYVVGNIDSNGAVTGKACKHAQAHSRYVAGKRWRWCIFLQEFCILRAFNDGITQEEDHLIQNWLVRNGYAEDESFEHGKPATWNV